MRITNKVILDLSLLFFLSQKVDSAFQNFKDYMENSFLEVTKSVINGAKDFDDNFKNRKKNIPNLANLCLKWFIISTEIQNHYQYLT